MCCFQPPVERVSETRIFARGGLEGRQFLVYAMRKSSVQDVAMILPLPVPANSPDDALKFIDLNGYPAFFDFLSTGFPGLGREAPNRSVLTKEPRLAVVEVGNFEASFVPSVKDFGRLDERFRIPASTWDALPVKGFGFAVFKLRKGETKVHPMAIDFPRADPSRLFFPTIHIHDGKVHATADFDHVLYCQSSEDERLSIREWEESTRLAGDFMLMNKAQGLVDGKRHVYRKVIVGRRKNEDILV